MNGRLFNGLNNLQIAFFERNVCINRNFHASQPGNDIAVLKKIASEKCGFPENFNFDCGKVNYAEGNVIGGTTTKRGQWPFLVIMYNLESGKFFCAGNLITHQHVLSGDGGDGTETEFHYEFHFITAAHCIRNKQQTQETLAGDVVVLLGRYNLSRVEPDSLHMRVNQIRLHPEWRSFSDKFDADISILIMEGSVQFTKYIQPVCLPTDGSIEKYFDGTLVDHEAENC